MSKVNILNVQVLDNPSTFLSKFKFKITFECLESLEDDLEWKIVYVSSAYDKKLDQILDSILVGPVPIGKHEFIFDADPPNSSKIPTDDIVGVTIVLLEAWYHGQEFARIGYYVNNEYEKEELKMESPSEPIISELKRYVIESDPRITRFAIKWGDENDVIDEVEENGEDNFNEESLPVEGDLMQLNDNSEEEIVDDEEDDDNESENGTENEDLSSGDDTDEMKIE